MTPRNAFPMALALLVVACAFTQSALAQSILGNWQTPTGSVLQVYSCGDAFCIKVLQIERSAPGTTDFNNPDPKLRSRSLCRLQIGSGFHPGKNQGSAEDGEVYDPETGKTYHGVMQAAGPDHLKLRGYIGITLFGRTEVWTRNNGSIPACH